MKHVEIKAMVVGIPNVGKSTFINKIAKRKAAAASDKPGVTRGKQWINIDKGLEMLDTPGILWPKFESQEVGLRLALIGSINDEILNSDELCCSLIDFLKEYYPERIKERYGADLDISGENHFILEKIAINRNCISKGGIPDIGRMSDIVLEEYRSGKLGRISLEIPEVRS